VSTDPPVITLLTDYGLEDGFVGVCHGVIAQLCPAARVIDISHGISRYDVQGGAVALAHALPFMPVGVHIAVVDPSVGSDRRAVALALADGRMLVGPDNGLLWPAALTGGGVSAAAEISGSRWRLEPLSSTFHGRDIFCPVGARLAAGGALADAGEPLDPATLIRLELPQAWVDGDATVATIVSSDGFGNAQLGAVPADLALRSGDTVELLLPSGELCPARFVRTFGDVSLGDVVLYEDSSFRLAIGLNQGSAMMQLRLRVGDEIRIERS
jgi:S-adenosylmethionine hydrolase